jgi:hypothetical protein
MSIVRSTTTVRSTLARRRDARRQQHQLARELAAYDTPAARADLFATLARHAPEHSAPIRRILTRRAYAPPVAHLR